MPLKGSGLYKAWCTQDTFDEEELRGLIQKRFNGLLESAKAKHSAPVQAELVDARRALAAMEAERDTSAAQAQASLSGRQTARTPPSGI